MKSKIEIVSVDNLWMELREFDKKSVWNDDEVWESVGLDEFVDDVNEMYKKKEGWYFLGNWKESNYVSEKDDGFGNECLEREVDFE